MNDDATRRHDLLGELFAAVVDLDESERSAVLASRCADEALRREVDELLEAHERTEAFIDTPALGPDFRLAPSAALVESALVGHRVGNFTIERVIAVGGMGAVYAARQAHPSRAVALKVMRQGFDSPAARRRFVYEAELLARLRHPGIARIYEAGVCTLPGADDDEPALEVPYLALELVEAPETITAFVRRTSPAHAARLELMAMVCDAVHHGHQHGVIHRDLKPGNILVGSDGVPRIIDYGIARGPATATMDSMHTGAGQVLGTIPYMSPEQFTGDSTLVSVRSDIYALGVVLYEVLAGKPPFDLAGKSVVAAALCVQHGAPPSLAGLDRRMGGDLDTIVRTALAKEPELRYPSASELGADLRRLLRDEPISARPPSAMYHMRKFACRHRAACVGFVLLGAMLFGTSIVTSGFAVEANEQRRLAVTAAEVLADLVARGTQSRTGEVTVHLADVAAAIDAGQIADPGVEADLRGALARDASARRIFDEARRQLTERLALRRIAPGPGGRALEQAMEDLATHELAQGRVEAARDLVDELLERRIARHGAVHWLVQPDDHLRALVLGVETNPVRHAELRRDLAAMRLDAMAIDAPVLPPPALPLAPILRESFVGTALDPAWRVRTENVDRWEGGIGAGRLEVTALEAVPAMPDTRGQLISSAHVLFERDLPRLGDLRLEVELGWDAAGRESAMHGTAVALLDGGGNMVLQVEAADHFIQAFGECQAQVRGVAAIRTGYDTLPARGTATLRAERRGDHVVFSVDDTPFAVATTDTAVLEVQVRMFHTALRDGRGSVSSFGPLWVEWIEVDGVETPSP